MLGFYFRHKPCFTFQARKTLVNATFLPVLDYGDILYTRGHQLYLSKGLNFSGPPSGL